MFRPYYDHLILSSASVIDALKQLDFLASDAILFVIDEEKKLIGTLTDGDLRRGFLKELTLLSPLIKFIQPNPKFVKKGENALDKVIQLRKGNFKIVPIVDKNHCIVNVINFNFHRSYLPIDGIIMAGGRGSRLRPLTDNIPKPLLRVGDKPIIDHNVDRLIRYGIDDFYLSLGYLGDQIKNYYTSRNIPGINFSYLFESKALGTIGAVSLIDYFNHENILITNSDILTSLDYEDFFMDYIDKKADMSVATVPYQVNIPYAVMETNNGIVTSFKEKPTYTYYSNGGIYLVKRALLEKIPNESFYNATDLMQLVIKDGGKLISYPIRQYWLDIGLPEDFQKAQEDVKHLDL